MSVGAFAASRGYRAIRLDRVASTNDAAMDRARGGDPGRLWIVADEQTGGRGRLGRVWDSPRGNLFASLLLMDPAPASLAPQLGFVAGLALFQALVSVGTPDRRLSLKWPNDALLDGAKLSGVLLEATIAPSGKLACVMGIGVNCVAHPRGLAYPATDLGARGVACTAETLFEALTDAVAREIEAWDRGEGFARVRHAWLERAAGLGSAIEVISGERRIAGVFRTIDAEGRLVLAAPSGDIAIDAGDVILPLSSATDGGQGNH